MLEETRVARQGGDVDVDLVEHQRFFCWGQFAAKNHRGSSHGDCPPCQEFLKSKENSLVSNEKVAVFRMEDKKSGTFSRAIFFIFD